MICRDCGDGDTYLYRRNGAVYCRDDFMERFGFDPVQGNLAPVNRS